MCILYVGTGVDVAVVRTKHIYHSLYLVLSYADMNVRCLSFRRRTRIDLRA